MQRKRNIAPVLSLILCVVVAVLATNYFLRARRARPVAHQDAAIPAQSNDQIGAAETAGIQETPSRPPDAARANPVPGERNAPNRQVLSDLTNNITLQNGRLPPEQLAQVKAAFQELVAQGPAAVPAIGELLKQNVDVYYGKGSAESIGAPTLRTALIETLRQIGGQEALALSREVLSTTGNPTEIAQLTRNLEATAPDEYSQESREAIYKELKAMAQNQPGNADVGPLFQALQTYGGSNAIADLELLAPKWNFYATMALAGLPSGQGIPAIAKLAMDGSPNGIGNQDFALQMLAQLSARYPDAGLTLLEMAKQNLVPEWSWPRIAEVLGGLRYQFTHEYPDNMFSAVDGANLRTHRQPNGNQNFVSLTVPTESSSGAMDQRLAVIDQLLAANPGPAALQALQQARARLTSVSPGK